MRVLVTGATGYVGAWTAKALQDDGHDVRVFVRHPDKVAGTLGAIGVRPESVAIGEIEDVESVRAAIKGCDAVIHCAAVVGLSPDKAEEMKVANVQGAKNVLGSAVEAGLKPVIHVSSATVLWDRGRFNIDPSMEPTIGHDPYSETKYEAENYARSLQEQGAPVVITYPGGVGGPPVGDRIGEFGQGVVEMLGKRMVPGKGAVLPIVDVRDVAAVHAAIVTNGSTAEPARYMLSPHAVYGTDLAPALSRLSGKRVMHVKVPDKALLGFGRIIDQVRASTPMPLPGFMSGFTESSMGFLTHSPTADSAPAEREFGLTYRPWIDTLAAVVEGIKATRPRH